MELLLTGLLIKPLIPANGVTGSLHYFPEVLVDTSGVKQSSPSWYVLDGLYKSSDRQG
jgi:hypothetical protein